MSKSRLVFVLIALAYAALVVWQAFNLPDRVPAHLGVSGEVDRWGTRGEHITFASLMGIMLAVFIGPWSPLMTFRGGMNIPNAQFWTRDENWPVARERIRDDLAVLGGSTLALIGVLMWDSGRIARGGDPNGWLMLGLIAGYLVLLVGYVVWMRRSGRYALPAEAERSLRQ